MIGIAGEAKHHKLLWDVNRRLLAAGRDCWIGDAFDPQRLAETEVLISIGVTCGAAEMSAAPKLRGIVSPVLGYDWVDVAEATKRGVAVANGEVPENRESMAEATIMLILALLYRLRAAEDAFAHGNWSDLEYGRMLRSKTVGIIGLGGISRAMIARLKPWGCDLQVHSRYAAAFEDAKLVSLNELMETSDVVVVATSLDSETLHLINRERIGLMKADAVLVNIARGAIVEEVALIEALKTNRIAGAALDTFEVEPPQSNHPLLGMANVILTPHAIGHTIDAAATVPLLAVENAEALLDWKLPASCKNPLVARQWPRVIVE